MKYELKIRTGHFIAKSLRFSSGLIRFHRKTSSGSRVQLKLPV